MCDRCDRCVYNFNIKVIITIVVYICVTQSATHLRAHTCDSFIDSIGIHVSYRTKPAKHH